ncbi:MAG: RNA methyltransferase [Candidatus Omnitrophota bacterium]|nr:RNA methyltransferase [Candidatus Omnitrophota bacterium]
MEKASKAKLREIRILLRNKKVRDEEGLFVAEGYKIVNDLLSKGQKVTSVYISSRMIAAPSTREFQKLTENKKVPVFRIPGPEFDKLSSLRNSQGILAVVKRKEQLFMVPPAGDEALLVLCDGIQDPGNLGTIIRTSAAFGADALLLYGETADIYNPKAVRASSGAVLDIPVHGCDIRELERLKKEGFRVLAGQVPGEQTEDIQKMSIKKEPVILAFGSEGRGVSREVLARADGFFCISIREKIESLNVTAAAAIALYVFSKNKK